jgi:Zn-finger nucleic acid-binding protein
MGHRWRDPSGGQSVGSAFSTGRDDFSTSTHASRRLTVSPAQEVTMNCPRCHTAELVERDRDGVLIDVCNGCRGVWLDRGELDKLIARALEGLDDDDDDDDDVAMSSERARSRRSRDRYDDDDDRGRRRRWWDIFD